MTDERKRLLLGLRSKPLRDRYHRVIGRKTRSSLDAHLHADLPHKQLRSLLCAQLSAVQAAADPNPSSPGSLSDTLHRRSTGIREGSLGILCFGRRLTVLHQVQVHVGHLRWFPPSSRGRAVVKSTEHQALRTEDRALRHPRLRHRPEPHSHGQCGWGWDLRAMAVTVASAGPNYWLSVLSSLKMMFNS